jgi:predicted RNA-binding Zn-ribbon protein involved in translation (DUF1610 family)
MKEEKTMLCEKCGSQLNDNSRFCPNCGAPIPGEEQFVTQTSTYEGPMGNPGPVLVWGILGLAFACSFFLSFLGIIFSVIGLKKANQFASFTGGAYSKQASIGRGLSKAGLIVGIILTVFFVIYLISLIALVNRYY